MFTGVLLHMVAAARPINAAFHRLPNRQRCADSVGDHAAMLLHIRYKGGAQHTGIAGLAAALRVKGGPVQLHGKLFPGRGADKHRGGKSLNIWACFV